MATNKLIMIASGLILLITTSSKCTREKTTVEGIPVTNYMEACEEMFYDFGEKITIGDPNDKFMISIPYQWDIRESYTDSLYGIFASNFLSIPIEMEKRMALTISGYQSDDDIYDYYQEELKELIRDNSIEVVETGDLLVRDYPAHWIRFNNKIDPMVFNLVIYIKSMDQNEVFLIQAVSYDSKNHSTKLCYMKQLINSFELVEN